MVGMDYSTHRCPSPFHPQGSSLRVLKRKFGLQHKQFRINYRAESLQEAQEFVDTAEG